MCFEVLPFHVKHFFLSKKKKIATHLFSSVFVNYCCFVVKAELFGVLCIHKEYRKR